MSRAPSLTANQWKKEQALKKVRELSACNREHVYTDGLIPLPPVKLAVKKPG